MDCVYKISYMFEKKHKKYTNRWASINTMLLQIVKAFCRSTLHTDRRHSLAICSQRN